MRKWILALTFFLPTTSFAYEYDFKKSLQKHDNRGYSTLNVLVWGNSCVNAMVPLFIQGGMHPSAAMKLSVGACACVIDEFREHYTYEQAMSLEAEVRRSKSFQFATYCGYKQEEGI